MTETYLSPSSPTNYHLLSSSLIETRCSYSSYTNRQPRRCPHKQAQQLSISSHYISTHIRHSLLVNHQSTSAMRSFNYMSAIFATAFALAAASPQQPTASSSRSMSSSSAASTSKVAETSININLKKATQTLSNPKLQLGRVTGSKSSQSSSSLAATTTSKRNPLVLPGTSSSSTKQSTSSKATSTKTSSSAAATATQSSSSKYSQAGDDLPSFYFGMSFHLCNRVYFVY